MDERAGSRTGFRVLAYRLLAAGALLGCHHAASDGDAAVDEDAERIFANVCARCHGADGKGGIAAGAANAPRNFCDSAFQASRTDEDLKQVIQKGKGAMPAFGTLFSDSDLTGLVRKLRRFTPKPP